MTEDQQRTMTDDEATNARLAEWWEREMELLQGMVDAGTLHGPSIGMAARGLWNMAFKAGLAQPRPEKPFGNPKTAAEANYEYYLVLDTMELRYPPQYADLAFDGKQEALLAAFSLELRGVAYSVYDKHGTYIKNDLIEEDRR